MGNIIDPIPLGRGALASGLRNFSESTSKKVIIQIFIYEIHRAKGSCKNCASVDNEPSGTWNFTIFYYQHDTSRDCSSPLHSGSLALTCIPLHSQILPCFSELSCCWDDSPFAHRFVAGLPTRLFLAPCFRIVFVAVERTHAYAR